MIFAAGSCFLKLRKRIHVIQSQVSAEYKQPASVFHKIQYLGPCCAIYPSVITYTPMRTRTFATSLTKIQSVHVKIIVSIRRALKADALKWFKNNRIVANPDKFEEIFVGLEHGQELSMHVFL